MKRGFLSVAAAIRPGRRGGGGRAGGPHGRRHARLQDLLCPGQGLRRHDAAHCGRGLASDWSYGYDPTGLTAFGLPVTAFAVSDYLSLLPPSWASASLLGHCALDQNRSP